MVGFVAALETPLARLLPIGRFWLLLGFSRVHKERGTMPSLTPFLWEAARPLSPYVWSCSECQAAFDLAPPRLLSPTQEQVDQINLQFEAHCKQVHPRLFPVIGLAT